MNKSIMQKARGLEKAELVLKNGRIINVYTNEIEAGDIAIENGMIIGIGNYDGIKEIDMKNHYIAPGLIDGHVHIESSMLTPAEFAKLIVPKGTTTIIADPHEIANVSGVEGIKFMLENSKDLPLNVYIMLPSCVPATSMENAGAKITAEDIESLRGLPNVLGLGEVMDYPAVLEGERTIHEKIRVMTPMLIDGHAPDIIGNDLNAYITAGVMTDHECTEVNSMIERLRRGMYVHLREGSVTRNLSTLLKGITKDNKHRVLFCTDDKHPEDIKKEGHINYNINLATKEKIEPLDAICMATVNAAQCYKLDHLGAIAPGKDADLIVFEDLYDIEPILVFKKGKIVAKCDEALFETKASLNDSIVDSVHFNGEDIHLKLPLKSEKVKVIELIESNITTKKIIERVKIKNNYFHYDQDKDILKLALIERHHNTKNVGIGLVKGFGFKNGALATTIAHDSHNLVVVGDSDEAMMTAIKKIKEIKGGIVLVKDNKVVDYLQLEIGGIMTNQGADIVSERLRTMHEIIKTMGLNEKIDDPFIQLSFLSLPVIPELKLTDFGLFDVNAFKHVPIEEE
ncbi:adenine deaminase [Liberiplasma polymorphum]|uniref:adenine deaminase n=1 Tax=Liberiplasma polymorphum TaxID=3374570 RepID=UPI0037758E68